MGNTGLLRREAEVTLLQPHLGDFRRQKLRNSPVWPTPLFKLQLVKDGEDFLLKNDTRNDSQCFGPNQNKPFHGPHHNKKRGSYRKRPYGGNSSQSSKKSFFQVGGNRTTEASEVIFDPILLLLSVPQGTLVCVWETFRLRRLHRLRILFSL